MKKLMILVFVLLMAGWVHVVFAQFTADEHLAERLEVAQYTASDELIYPSDTDRWVVVGA